MDNVIQRISVNKEYSIIHRLRDFSNGWRYLHQNNRSQEVFPSVIVIFIKYFFDVEFKQSCDSRWTLRENFFRHCLRIKMWGIMTANQNKENITISQRHLGLKRSKLHRRGKTWVTVAFSCASDWLRGGVSFLDQSQSRVKHVNAILYCFRHSVEFCAGAFAGPLVKV